MIFGYFTLFVALVISAVAEFYSIIGLMAIFAAAPIPVAIMGAALGVGKITAAVWLKLNWSRASWTYKVYLIPAVSLLMALTSMGIFGFLSKAHSDQSLVGGDVLARLEIIDEKIKTSKDNIEANRKALKQLDDAVDQLMGRSTTEAGADKAVQVRRAQARDRTRLLAEIQNEQKIISKLNEEAAPIRAEVRKVEAEVGPIKYIAAMIYGDTADTNLLESAVRWVIIFIVIVFDPLALVLILSAQQSLRWAKEEKLQLPRKNLQDEQGSTIDTSANEINNNETLSPAPPAKEVVAQELKDLIPEAVVKKEPSLLEQHPYLNTPFVHFTNIKPIVYKPDVNVGDTKKKRTPRKKSKKIVEPVTDLADNDLFKQETVDETKVKTESSIPFYSDLGNDYYDVEGKMVHSRVLKDLYPEVYADINSKKLQANFGIKADDLTEDGIKSKASFGTQFPERPQKGEIFLHVGTLPSRLFKFNGGSWIQVDKSITDSYTYDEDYLKYLVENLSKGIVSADDLTDSEQQQIEEYLKKNA